MLTNKQSIVIASAAVGLSISLAMLYVGTHTTLGEATAPLSLHDRLHGLALGLLAPATCLLISIARLANHRFFTPADIDGDPNHPDTPSAVELQRVLQNTLEQAVLTATAYIIWALVAPDHWLQTLPLFATLFAVGRILFFIGHSKGAIGRALGFTLTFYPTVVLLITEAVLML
ncbi:MAG: MAPEG family protein [Fluviibacter sp.]